MQAHLTTLGFSCVIEVSPLRALELVKHNTYGLLITDLRMPEMDGWTVWARMHAEPMLATIPVVMVSGDPEQSRRAQALGMRNFVRKPIDAETLLATVARYCDAAAEHVAG